MDADVTTLVETPTMHAEARAEALEVIALALDAAAWGPEECPVGLPDGPAPSSEALDDAEVCLAALLERPDLLVALVAA